MLNARRFIYCYKRFFQDVPEHGNVKSKRDLNRKFVLLKGRLNKEKLDARRRRSDIELSGSFYFPYNSGRNVEIIEDNICCVAFYHGLWVGSWEVCILLPLFVRYKPNRQKHWLLEKSLFYRNKTLEWKEPKIINQSSFVGIFGFW